jgi:hypothetical protein
MVETRHRQLSIQDYLVPTQQSLYFIKRGHRPGKILVSALCYQQALSCIRCTMIERYRKISYPGAHHTHHFKQSIDMLVLALSDSKVQSQVLNSDSNTCRVYLEQTSSSPKATRIPHFSVWSPNCVPDCWLYLSTQSI